MTQTTTTSKSGAAYVRANVADTNSYFNEWRCRCLPLRLPPPILFTLLIPLTIVFVGKGVIMKACSEQMENITLSFGISKIISQRILKKHA